MGAVTLNGWYAEFPDHTVAGSLYAVPPAHRLEAARLLDQARCRVHVDVIVGPEGHRGVTWPELHAVREVLPHARIDLHLIVLHGLPCPEESESIAAARDLRVESIAMAGVQIARHRDVLDQLRADGVDLYEELAPALPHPRQALNDIDGALVMFIPPGTTQSADLTQLAKVEALSPTMAVGVDGGITHDVARQCHDRGAGYLVSGRNLLFTASPDTDQHNSTRYHSTTRERRSA